MNTQKIVVEMSDKLKRDEAGKLVMEKYTDDKGKEKERPVVDVPGKKYEINVTAPEVSDFSQEQIAQMIAAQITSETRNYARQCEKDGVEVGDFSLTVSDLLGARIEIPDALVEKVQNEFKAFLAKAGKAEKAQKNNAALLVAGVNVLTKTDARMIAGYEKNLESFAASLEGESVGEFSPVLDRAAKRLEKAKSANTESLI